MRACLPLLLLLCLGGIACGGADEGRPPGLQPGAKLEEFDHCSAAKGYEFLPLLDFEPHTITGGTISKNAQCNPDLSSSCSFYFNYDTASSPANESPVLKQGRGEDCLQLAVAEDAEVFTSPRLSVSTLEAEEIKGGRCGDESWGLHIITENVGMCYGSDGRLGWGATLDITFSPALDASEWEGISLWVKNAPHGEKPAIIVQFKDPHTSGAQDPVTLEPTCDSSDPAVGQQPVPDSEKCDPFGTAVTLADDWMFVPARFDQLKQKGFGVVSPLGQLKADEINIMQIFMSAGNADYWIDDLALFRSEERSAE